MMAFVVWAGEDCSHVQVGPGGQKMRKSHATFIGKGCVEQISRIIQAKPCERSGAVTRIGCTEKAWTAFHLPPSWRRVIVNAVLTGVQQRNLEAAWGVPVWDRVGLIIKIFGQRAQTREAKLQVSW